MLSRHDPLVVVSFLVTLLWISLGSDRRLAGADRPAGPLHKTRSAVMARQGMAATSQPLATAAAIQVLQQGGNAVDAAIAANAVLGVVEPMSCGLGGDLFAIVWDSKTKKLYGLNASGRSPEAATISFFQSRGLKSIPVHGPLS
jgi:gamma-glutamyltranspeptidase / glutathione hydrolase